MRLVYRVWVDCTSVDVSCSVQSGEMGTLSRSINHSNTHVDRYVEYQGVVVDCCGGPGLEVVVPLGAIPINGPIIQPRPSPRTLPTPFPL